MLAQLIGGPLQPLIGDLAEETAQLHRAKSGRSTGGSMFRTGGPLGRQSSPIRLIHIADADLGFVGMTSAEGIGSARPLPEPVRPVDRAENAPDHRIKVRQISEAKRLQSMPYRLVRTGSPGAAGEAVAGSAAPSRDGPPACQRCPAPCLRFKNASICVISMSCAFTISSARRRISGSFECSRAIFAIATAPR